MHLFQRANFDVGYEKGLFLSFLLGFVMRLIPEVLSYPYPIGFDTLYYAARMKEGVVWYHWSQVFSTWLIYAILISAYNVVQDAFLLLKLVTPTLYGLNSYGVYYFSSKALGWGTRKSLIASLFFAFSMASLGLSWQFHRNMLGLAILLFTLPWIKNMETKKGFAWFVLLSALVVFGHELASVTLFAVVLAVVASDFLRGERRRLVKPLAATSLASALFLASIYFRLFPAYFHVKPNVVNAGDTVRPGPGGVFFFVDYLHVVLPFMHYPTYLNLAAHVLSLFSLLYLVWLPLVFVGFFRDKLLDGWAGLLLVGSFNALITPFFALDLWFRWMLMLVYPFTFYAVNGIERVWGSQGSSVAPGFKWMGWMKVSKRSVVGISLLTVLLGSIYMTTPLFFDKFGVFSIPTTYGYIPSTMLYNTIPLRDVEGTVKALEWLNGHMNDGSAVLLQHPFSAWADLYLDKKHVIVYYQIDVKEALRVALKHGFDPIFLVWWKESIGWYGPPPPNSFMSVFSSDRISVFKYIPHEA